MAGADIDDYIETYFGQIKENVDEIFSKFDKDGNGFIDAKELDSFIKDICNNELSEDDVASFKTGLLAKLDENNDNKISKKELRKVLPTKSNFMRQFLTTKEFCQVDFIKIWKNYDKDGSGFLEKPELQLFLEELFAVNKTPGQRIDEKEREKFQTILLDGKEGVDKKSLMKHLGVKAACDEVAANAMDWKQADFDEKFAKYDKDNSGCIESGELEVLFRDLLKINDTDITEEDVKDYVQSVVMPDLDKNKDNKIQKDELKSYLKIK
ncbi:calbindin isoform X1 [Nematostella vectensis]|uniref:calbindin isoform X1 n=1 Tax=Nematostella vectensis TaxID=45351 RepID=UPI0020772F86|nr:calbindin isoform X1 [Nematostella vectensis]